MVQTSAELSHPTLKAQLIDSKPIRYFQWIILVLAVCINILDGFDVTAMAYAAHHVGEELQLSEDKLGLLFSVTLAGMMLGATALTPLSDAFGRRPTIIVWLGIIGISVLLTALSTSLWSMILLRLITGLGVGAMLANVTVLVSEYTPKARASFAVMAIVAGYPAGASMGGFVAAPLLADFGWPAVFIAGGSLTLMLMMLAIAFIPESLEFLQSKQTPTNLVRLNKLLKKLGEPSLNSYADIQVISSMQHQKPAQPSNAFGLLNAEFRGKTLKLWATFFFCFICLYFLMSWLPKLVINSGLSESMGIYASIALNGGGAIGILTLGFFTRRLALSVLIAIFLLVAAVGMTAIKLFTSPDLFLGYLFVLGFLLQGGFTGLYAIAAKLYPVEIRATGVGWSIGLGRFGAVVGPYVGGLLIAASVSMEWNFILFAIPLSIAGLFAYSLRVR